MQQFRSSKVSNPESVDSGFGYIDSSLGGRYYSDWGVPTRKWVNIGPNIKGAIKLKFSLLALVVFQIIFAIKSFSAWLSIDRLHFLRDEKWILAPMFATLIISMASAAALPIGTRFFTRYGALCFGAILLLFYAQTLSIFYFYASLIFSAALAFSALARIHGTKARRSAAQYRLPPIDSPSPFSQEPVTVRVYSSDFLLGEDVGWVSFVDQFLHFQGTRTEFSLLAADVPLSKSELYSTLSGNARSKLKLLSSGAIRLTWNDDQDQELLIIEPLTLTGSKNANFLEDFKAKTVLWRIAPKTLNLASTFPPCFASPETMAETRKRITVARVSLAIALLLICALLIVELYCLWQDLPQFFGLVVATLLLAILFAIGFCRQIRYGNRQLARENKIRLDKRNLRCDQ
jgi:hypothetical protein